MEDEEFLINNDLFEEEEENVNLEDSLLEEEFLKPSNILMDVEEEGEYGMPLKKEISIEINPAIKLIKNESREIAEDDYLFTIPKLIYNDKVLDKPDDNEEEDNYLFKPIELVYEDRLEIFNKRREQGIVMTSSKSDDKKKNKEIKPKGFLSSLRDEIKLKALKK